MARYSYCFFDLDGTLLYTLEDLKDSMNFILKAYGYPEKSLDEIRHAVGNGLSKLAERCFPSGSDTEAFDEKVRRFKAYYAAHSDIKTRVYDGICDMLDSLKDAGIEMAVITNKVQIAADTLTEKYFPSVMSAVHGDREGCMRKPSPEPVLEVMHELGAKAEECIYVGDSEVDMQTAENAGLSCILCSWGFRGRDACLALSPDFVADTPREAADYILGTDLGGKA